MKRKTTVERGVFKNEIHAALYNYKPLRDLILGDTTGRSAGEIRKAFRDHVKSHLFIDDTIMETDTFIFYDVVFPSLRAQTKQCKVVLYAICHRDILDESIEADGYYGNRADVLTEMIEDCLINDEEQANSFGIGKLSLDSVDIFNDKRVYGSVMVFTVPDFR